MKKMILAALAMAVSLPAATFTYAQYDDDIYFSSSSAERYEPVRETVMEEWSTNANNDWDIDSYNRRSADVALYSASTDDTYTQSVTSNRHQNFQFGTEQASADDNIIHDTVYVVENYYYTDRIRRFHNPWCSYHIWNPYWDVAYWDPFYWDYCYWDPWWYVSPSFGFHYGSWYWGWNYGYYTGWYGGWYSPFYRPFPHYYGPYYGGSHHGWHSLPNQGPRTNNMGGSYARNNRNGARRPDNRHYTADARRSGIEGGGASYSTRGASANRNSNMRMSNDQISRNAGTRSDSRNLTTGGTTVRSNRGENYTRSAATVANRAQANNSNARRQANGVRQNSSGRTYRSTERAASSSNSFNRSSATRSSSYRSGSSRSYNNSSSYSNSSSSSSTRSYTPSNSSSSSGGSYSGSRSSGSSGSFGGRSGGSSGSFGGRSGGGRR